MQRVEREVSRLRSAAPMPVSARDHARAESEVETLDPSAAALPFASTAPVNTVSPESVP